jgi:serine/threonine-protein kinase
MLDKDPSRRPSATEVAACLDGISCAVPSTTASEVASPRLLAPGIAEGTIFAHHYRVEGLLGAGGMGVVVSARHTELGTLVALKLLRPGSRADPSRFLREARAASQLESEHSVRVLEFGRADDGTPYLIMEHLKGRDLAARLAEDGPLSVEMAVTYVLETCEAIAEAHALGIVHRDLKPSNLFLVRRRDGSEIVKVLDFGISKMSDSREDTSRPLTVTDPEVVLGSVPYMSPEQLQASTHVDARADVWSLGIVLHELLTGKRPFEAATAPAIAARIVGAEPIRLRDVRPDAPGLLEDVILACLAKAPFRRYPNLAAFAGALRPFASHQASASIDRVVRLLGLPDDESTRPSTTLERASRSPARGKPTRARVTKAVALAAGVFGLAGIAYASWPRRTSDRSTTPPLEASVSSREPARDSTSPTAASPTVPSAALPPPSSEPTASLTTAASSPLVAGGRAPAAPRRPATVSPPVRPSAARAGDARPNSRLDLRDPNLERR